MKHNISHSAKPKIKKILTGIAIALGSAAVLGGAVFGITKAVQASNKAYDEFIDKLEEPSKLLQENLFKDISENFIELSNGAEIDLTGINYNFGKNILETENNHFDIYGNIQDNNLEYSFNARYSADSEILKKFTSVADSLTRSNYQKYVETITELFKTMKLVDVYVHQGEAVHTSLKDSSNQNALLDMIKNRYQPVSMELNAKYISTSHSLSPIFERAYTIEEDGKTYAVLHLDFMETQITKWTSYKIIGSQKIWKKQQKNQNFIRSEIFKVEIGQKQNLSRDEIVNLIIENAKEKNPALISETDFMTRAHKDLILDATKHLNEAKNKTTKQEKNADLGMEQ